MCGGPWGWGVPAWDVTWHLRILHPFMGFFCHPLPAHKLAPGA